MKDFIPYEEALELKQLGFNESIPTFYSYPENKLSYTMDGHNQVSVRRNSQFGQAVSAPTFSQAFRFFREKHLLVVSQDRDGGWWIFKIKTVEDEDNEGCKKVKDGHIIKDEYEEAELECLKKLIQIVKQKS